MRIAALVLFLSLTVGCAARGQQPTTQAQTAPRPPAQTASVAPEPHYTVPTDTTDPEEVRIGVDEWLRQHHGYGGARHDAIMKRMRQESGFEPCVISGPHHYLLQWRDSRVTSLWREAHVRPGQCPSWLSQMEHMDKELHEFPRFARFFETNDRNAYWVFTTVYLGGRT